MKSLVLQELAARWKRDNQAENESVEDGSKQAQAHNALKRGVREGKAECADDLLNLIKLLGDD